MRQNVLVLCKNSEMRESLAIPLRAEGFTVAPAPDVSAAVRVLHSTSIDTVLVLTSSEDQDAAKKIHARILKECPESRVVLLSRQLSLEEGSHQVRFAFENYQLSEQELIGFLQTRPAQQAAPKKTEPEMDPGVRSLLQVIDVLVGLQELGDQHFGGSSHGAMRLAEAVARELELPPQGVQEVALATLIRDIGKAGLSHEVVSENGTFNEEQVDAMREHVNVGVRLLEHIDFPWKVLPVIRHHHERYDGLGYPDGLKGQEIPLGARILAVVDSYVAMLSGRSYRDGLSREEAFEELQRNTGTQFDPEVVEIVMRLIDEQTMVHGSDQKPRVLFVGPDREFAKLLKFQLVKAGMKVKTVKSLKEAVAQVVKKPPALVLAEIGTDEDAAFEALRQIREDDNAAQVPFALIAPNGSRVVKLRALRHGIDDFLLKTDNLEELVARVENILAREATRRGDKALPTRRGITGDLENLSLPDVFQMLSLGMKTACVTIRSRKRNGIIWFRNGNVVNARANRKHGSDAVYEMLRWKTGGFSIEHGIEADEDTIEMDTMFMLMEGLRMLDEEAARAAGIH